MPESGSRDGGWFAAFASREALHAAIDALHDAGISRLEAYLPWDDPASVARLTTRPSRLPRLVFAGAVLGAVLAYGIQWYANVVSYPLDIGGRPAHAVVAFIVPTFEGAVLAAAFTAFLAALARIGLPALWHPTFELEGFRSASRDGWWLAVDGRDSAVDTATIGTMLRDLGALRVERLGEGDR